MLLFASCGRGDTFRPCEWKGARSRSPERLTRSAAFLSELTGLINGLDRGGHGGAIVGSADPLGADSRPVSGQSRSFVLDFVRHMRMNRGDAGKRGRWCFRQLPVQLVDQITCVSAVVLRLYGRGSPATLASFNFVLYVDRVDVSAGLPLVSE